jgi:predicted permease
MEIFLTSIQSIVPIIVIIILGYFLQVRGWFKESFGNDLSKLIMNVAMPVAIFTSVLKYLTLDKLISLSGGLLYTFIAFILGYLAAFIAVKIFKVRPGRRGTMINTFVNANTIFIGLPLNIALFGDQALPYFLVYYITNTVSTWTLGVYLMTSDSKEGASKQAQKFNWKKLFPAPLLGFLVALVFLVLRIPVPSFAESTLTYIGSLTTPLSLVYIGIVLAKAGLQTIRFDKDTISLPIKEKAMLSFQRMWSLSVRFYL